MFSRRAIVSSLAVFLLLSSLFCLKNGLPAQIYDVAPMPSSLGAMPGSQDNRTTLSLAQDSPKLVSPVKQAAPVPVPTPPEPIVLTYVFVGSPAAEEGLTSIKSALIHSSRALDIHIICTEEAVAIAEAPLTLLRRPYYDVNVTFHVITRERVQERLIRAGLNPDPGFLTKVLIHEVLVGVDKAIFVDTDMIFVVDPVQLWDTFDTLDEQTMIAMPTLGPKSHAGEICTCVMLLHLDRMRNPALHPSSSSSSSSSSTTLLVPTSHRPSVLDPVIREAMRTGIQTWHGADPPGTLLPFDPGQPPFGDQGVVWVLWRARPELFAHLSLRWDLTHCRQAYGVKLFHGTDAKDETMMSEEEHTKSQIMTNGDELIVPGILHFNCQYDAGPNVWTWSHNHDSKTQTWAAMIMSVVRYKWIWLNRGTLPRSGHTNIKKKVGVRWLDEDEDVPAH